MRSWLVAALLTASLGQPSGASTFFYVRGEGGDFVGRLAVPPKLRDESAAVFRVQGDPADALTITVRGTDELPWHVIVNGPPAGPIVPGTYESAAGDPNPVVVVNGEEQTCAGAAARVTVHGLEVVDGTITTLTLDFEQHCSADPAAGLYGSIRYRTGRLACAGQAEGTPCDDFDACTPVAQCLGDECVPTAPREPCAASAQCYENGVCDPLSAACSPPVPATGTACDDGSACTTDDACHTGLCTGTFLTCDDGSPCTVDECDPELGCVHTPIAGQCWALAGRTVVRVRALGKIGRRRIRCRARCMMLTHEVLLVDGDTYRIAEGPTECTTGTFDLTDEVGTLASRRKQTTFEPGNLAQVQLDLLACRRFELLERERVMRLADDGTTLDGWQHTRARMSQAIPTAVRITTEFTGRPYDPDALPEPPPLPGRLLQPCRRGIPAQCTFDPP